MPGDAAEPCQDKASGDRPHDEGVLLMMRLLVNSNEFRHPTDYELRQMWVEPIDEVRLEDFDDRSVCVFGSSEPLLSLPDTPRSVVGQLQGRDLPRETCGR